MAAFRPAAAPVPESASSDGKLGAPIEGQLVDGHGRLISTAILYEVVRALTGLAPGDVITVRTDSLPAVDSDIRAWCRTTGHQLAQVVEGDDARDYAIRKAPRCASSRAGR